MSNADGTVSDLVEAQIQHQGVSVISTRDGTTFVFTLQILEQMIERARAMGKVLVFVKHGVSQ